MTFHHKTTNFQLTSAHAEVLPLTCYYWIEFPLSAVILSLAEGVSISTRETHAIGSGGGEDGVKMRPLPDEPHQPEHMVYPMTSKSW